MWLAAGGFRAEVRPEQGGMLAALRFQSKSGWCDILRPEPSAGAFQDQLPLFGSFAMVPFANRLPAASLPFGQGRVDFPRNWPSEDIAHHGMGWAQAWTVDAVQEDSCALSAPICDVTGRLLGRAHQRFDVTAEGLDLRLSYRHLADAAMPVGLGQHPWFHTPEPDFRAEFTARGEFHMGPDHLPQHHLAVEGARRLASKDNGFNGCFSGWSGHARLLRPTARLEVCCRSDSRLLHCYVAGGLEALCLEPVTHRPDAADDARWSDLGGMPLLARGQDLSILTQITARDLGE
jgi:aldose 1-epimerase